MGSLERSIARDQGRMTAKEGSRVFREALRVGTQVESAIKATVCKLPFWRRVGIAARILAGRWK
jgi:hypothetical protein